MAVAAGLPHLTVSASQKLDTHAVGLQLCLSTHFGSSCDAYAHLAHAVKMQVERYHYFGSSIRAWYPGATALLEGEQDESADNGMLATCLRVLTEVHERFFEGAVTLGGTPPPPAAAAGAPRGAGAATATQQPNQQQDAAAVADGVGADDDEQEEPSAVDGVSNGIGDDVDNDDANAVLLDPGPLLTHDVRMCLRDVRAEILAGCKVVFSR